MISTEEYKKQYQVHLDNYLLAKKTIEKFEEDRIIEKLDSLEQKSELYSEFDYEGGVDLCVILFSENEEDILEIVEWSMEQNISIVSYLEHEEPHHEFENLVWTNKKS
jgi:hypothetical protein